jgi:hypothetical protein
LSGFSALLDRRALLAGLSGATVASLLGVAAATPKGAGASKKGCPTPTKIQRCGTPTASPTPSAPDILGVAYWKGQFDGQATSFANYNTPKSTTGDSMDYYDMAYGVDGYVSMFEATGQTSYLTSAITLVNNVIADAVVSSSLGPAAFGDSFLGWVTQRPDLVGEEVPLFESYCWRYVTRLLTALKNNSVVYANPTFKAHYDSILAFTEVNIFDKWYTRGLNSYIYRQNTNMASHWAYIACHLRQHTLNSTRQTRCDTIRSNIDSVGIPNYSNDSMRAKMTASLGRALSGAYSWDSDWTATARPGQDSSHACGEITWICESLDYFTVWNATDVARFGKTLTDLIMPTHATYVDGTGSGTGWIADGWPKLGRFSVAIQQALEGYDVQSQGQYMASMCENARRWGVA